MYKLFSKLIFFLFFPFFIAAQEFNYVHYGTREGLPSTVVYDMCQDKDGFMWFATENGLSRYDGTNFKTFSVEDGLPENEVVKVFGDSKGRLWIGCFSKELCFYYKGKIYNKGNCGWLSKIELNSGALSICEDEKGALLVSDLRSVFIINDRNEIKRISDEPYLKPFEGQMIYGMRNYQEGGFFLLISNGIYRLRKDSLVMIHPPGKTSDRMVTIKELSSGEVIQVEIPDAGITHTKYGNATIFISTTNGAWSVDTLNYKLETHFLPGKKISRTISDNESDIWFSTLDEGVYRLPSRRIKNVLFVDKKDVLDRNVFALADYNQNVICGLQFSRTAFIKNSKVVKVKDYGSFANRSTNNSSVNRLNAIKPLFNGAIMFGFDAFLVKYEKGVSRIRNIIATKSIDQVDGDHIVVGTYDGVYKLSVNDLEIIDTIYRGRCTKIFYRDKRIYIGTLAGLYVFDEFKRLRYLGDLNQTLTRRITDIKAGEDNVIWVSTNDNGVIAYKDGNILRKITEKQGLSSNICKSLFVNNEYLFVGTNRGINKIDLQNKNAHILNYSESDGLPSDIINCLLVKNDTLYVGSPKGLAYFNENDIDNKEGCNLQLLNVNISGLTYQPIPNYSLSYKDNNISFEYVAISFKSGGEITYHYKLSGLDTAWRTITQTNLIYQTLPSGTYNLQLYAVNKFGQKSKTYQVNFSISTPFWKTWWAYALGILSIIFSTAYLLNRRHKLVQQRLIEKNNFQKQFAALEQQALQAQMNPHFIFNCLNSIQQYILTNNKEKANQYLTGFASLIRQTLYISGKKSISISEEISFLSDYLGMEQMRFGDTFVYELWVAKTINTELMEMPPLLLQPYLENALRHGIRHMQNGIGKVIVSFDLIEDTLVCCISDNGVGREKAAMYKNKLHIEYQSKGMSLTEKRVELINKINDRQIFVKVTDLHDTQGKATGTEVVVQIPV